MNSWFGSGLRTKSVGSSARPMAATMSAGSSASVTPPVRRVASSSAGISVIQSVSSRAKIVVTSSGRSLRCEQPLARVAVLERLGEQLVEQQHLDAALAHQVDERVELLAGAAHPDHVVEQQLVAVRRRQALVREVGPVDDHAAQRPDLGRDAELGGGGRGCHGFSSQLRTAAPPTNRHADDEGGGDERPDELQVAVVAHLGEGEAAHDHRGGRGDQVHEAGGRLVGGHGHRARDVGEVGERRQDRHHERGVPGRRRHEERDRDVDDQRDHAEHALARCPRPRPPSSAGPCRSCRCSS